MTADLTERINEALDGTTPGPWHWKKDFTAPGDDGTGLALTDESATVEIVGAYNFHCCSFRDDPTVGSDADARLIAAAPALLREAAEQLAAMTDVIETLREVAADVPANEHPVVDVTAVLTAWDDALARFTS